MKDLIGIAYKEIVATGGGAPVASNIGNNTASDQHHHHGGNNPHHHPRVGLSSALAPGASLAGAASAELDLKSWHKLVASADSASCP